MAAAYNGKKSFGAVADGYVRTCAILACTNNNSMSSCGIRYKKTVLFGK